MKRKVWIKSIAVVIVLAICVCSLFAVSRHPEFLRQEKKNSPNAVEEAGAESVVSEAESVETASNETMSAESDADAGAVSPTDFAEVSYSDSLMGRNSVIWAIQNYFYNEDGTPQELNTKRITDILAAKKYTIPVKDVGDPSQMMSARTLLKLTYLISENPNLSEHEVSDATLTNWSKAVRIENADPKLDEQASAQEVIRCLYYIDGGKHELTELEQRYPFFYQGAGFYDGASWRHFDWQHAKFSINGHEMWEAGCGFVATAMALSYLSGKIIGPVDFMENGEYTGDGAAHTVGVNSAAQYGIKAHRTADWKEVESALRDGLPVMVLETGPSMWAKTGHYILVSGLTPEGKVTVYNPGGDVHFQYAAEDYGLYSPEQIYSTANPELPYTIFGR